MFWAKKRSAKASRSKTSVSSSGRDEKTNHIGQPRSLGQANRRNLTVALTRGVAHHSTNGWLVHPGNGRNPGYSTRRLPGRNIAPHPAEFPAIERPGRAKYPCGQTKANRHQSSATV